MPRVALHAPFLGADGAPIDDGIALLFPAPHSYTGENVLELQGHGGPVVLRLIVERCLQAGRGIGLRIATPGEFTQRAFLNDRLDLAQAEAVADLIDASTELAARSAVRSLAGEFSRRVHALHDVLVELRMLVEATLDFPEEEIDFLQKADATGRLAAPAARPRPAAGAIAPGRGAARGSRRGPGRRAERRQVEPAERARRRRGGHRDRGPGHHPGPDRADHQRRRHPAQHHRHRGAAGDRRRSREARHRAHPRRTRTRGCRAAPRRRHAPRPRRRRHAAGARARRPRGASAHGAEQDRPGRAAAARGRRPGVAVGEDRRRGRSAARRTEAHRRLGTRHDGRDPHPRARAPRRGARARARAPGQRQPVMPRSATRRSTCSPRSCASPATRWPTSPASSRPTICSASSSAGSASASRRPKRRRRPVARGPPRIR